MKPVDRRQLITRTMNEALSQLACAGIEPPEAAKSLAREVALQLRAYEGGEGAAESLYRLGDEMAVTK